MTNIFPFLRKVKVLIGPVEEWKGGGDPNQALALYGDGTQDGFRIKFMVNKFICSTASPSVISIYNLSQETRNAINKRSVQIALSVGWSNTDFVLLHTGSLLQVVSRRQGPDIVTDVITNPSYGGMSRTIISETWSGGVIIKDLVEGLAREIPGITVDSKKITIPSSRRTGSQGFSFVGPVNEGLDKLSRVYGFSWGINNKAFYACSDGLPIGNEKPIISGKDGSLLRAEPMLATPLQKLIGVSIYSLLNPYVQVGYLVGLDSIMNPTLNGDYFVHSLTHSGDTHSQQYETYIESYVLGATD